MLLKQVLFVCKRRDGLKKHRDLNSAIQNADFPPFRNFNSLITFLENFTHFEFR